MEFDFIYLPDSRRYSLKLATEQQALQHFLLEEFELKASSYQPLINALSQLGRFDSYQFHGREYQLQVENREVRISHHSIGYIDPQAECIEEELGLDDAHSYAECGLEDLLHLLNEWQQFLPK